MPVLAKPRRPEAGNRTAGVKARPQQEKDSPMNTQTNLTYFLIGFINGARPEELELERMSGAATRCFPDLAQDDEAFRRALKAALLLAKDILVQRLKGLVARANEQARTQTRAVAAPARR